MSSEYRIIEFNHVELAGALAAHSIAQGTHIVVGTPNALNIDIEKVTITATWAPTRKRPETRVSYGDSEICQALIRHCKTLGIPLPATSKKSVRVLNGHITILVELVKPPTSPLVPLEYLPVSLSQDG